MGGPDDPKKPANPEASKPSKASTPSPKPQPAPVPAGPISDFSGLARTLATQIRDGKRDDVLQRVKKLTDADRDRLESVLIPTLERDKLRPHGIELRRTIRYVRHPPPVPKPDKFTTSGGKDVEFKTGKLDQERFVSGKIGEKSSLTNEREGYSLFYLGPDTLDSRWLQMIWRDAVLVFANGTRVAVRRREDHLATMDMPYFLSTHPERARKPEVRNWHADAPKTTSPFYDTAIRRSGSVLYMFDAPSPTIPPDKAKAHFASANPPASIVSGFHAETFLVRGMDVLYRVKVEITWIQTKGKESPAPAITLAGEKATEIRAEHRARLAIQASEFTWLPGPLVSEPLPEDDFERIQDLTNTGWSKGTSDGQRLSDVSQQADTGQVQFLRTRYLESGIHVGTPFQAGLNVGGLKSAQGETGYIDAKGNYSNPALPITREGPPPPVSVIVGSTAFHQGSIDYTREWPVGTMRHEMRHVTQAGYAIGWLMRWRDDFTSALFPAWLDAQFQKDKDDARLQVARAGVGGAISAIEVLAYTEGFIAGVYFLPASVNPALLVAKERWPSALRELQDAGTRLNSLFAKSASKMQEAALAKIRRFACGAATPAEKDALVKWLNAVIDPAKIAPPPTESVISLVKGMFSGQSAWLKAVLDTVTKPCPR